MYWGYIVDILGLYKGYMGDILGVCWVCIYIYTHRGCIGDMLGLYIRDRLA